ncbi:MAG: hypothetical protein IKG44_04135 [Mogibacterium sp.]|nr:hypothetical protein [Mogibacterium sp.]
MTEKRTAKLNRMKRAASVIALLLCVLIAAGCSAKSEPEKKVAKELDALKTSESVGSEVSDMEKLLSDEGKDNFDTFLKKLRDFDYELTGVKEGGDQATVTVRIKTYDFGRAYLAEWTEYLREHGDSLAGDEELTGFYEELFAKLAALDKKESIKDVDIVCVKPLDNGEWIANIKDNEQLQDAVFGGMMSEMKTLAGE